jgi:hypothetical protein
MCRHYGRYDHSGYQPAGYAGQYEGYYDQYGQWHSQGMYGQGYGQWGYGDQWYSGWNTYGAGGNWGGNNAGPGGAPPAPPKPEAKEVQDKSAGGKGKGFSMKMGDRAHVKQTFTLEQRQAKEGKLVMSSTEAGDEYGADILLGAGGMVCSAESVWQTSGRPEYACKYGRFFVRVQHTCAGVDNQYIAYIHIPAFDSSSPLGCNL